MEYSYPLTPHGLVNATHSNNLNQVKRIIESGVSVNDYTGNTMPALTCACCNGNVEMVEYLLSQGANPNNYTEKRISPLKSIANSSSPHSFTIVKLLLDAGADPNYEKTGNVALTLACDVSNDVDLIRLLLHVTDEKYYQKAYEYSQTEEIRNLFKEVCSVKAPNMILIDPANGFGGPQYKMKVHYDTPLTMLL
jgi:ankyrin repeat protein